MLIAVSLVLPAENSRAQGCPPITLTPASQSADLFVATSDGSCTLDATENGGYIKAGVTYKLHISAAVEGLCQYRAFQYPPGECVNNGQVKRAIGTSSLTVDSYVQGYVLVDPPNSSDVQSYDTRTSTNTNSNGVSFSTTWLGEHVLTSSTNAGGTLCNFTPTSFSQNQAITFNTLSCEPLFNLLGNNIIHVAPPPSPNKVKVYLDPTMSSADSALSAAVTDWNAYLSSTGVSFDVVTTSCSGADCIAVTTSSGQTRCGYSSWISDSSGIITGNASLSLRTDWTTYSFQGLQRTFVHELGHFLGLGDYNSAACQPSDAMMQDQFVCTSTTTATNLTMNDHLPATNSTYGGKTRKACGF